MTLGPQTNVKTLYEESCKLGVQSTYPKLILGKLKINSKLVKLLFEVKFHF